MIDRSFPEHLFDLGYTDLISVIPPNGVLVPSSKIAQSSVGKVPGRKLANGLYAGFDWRRHQTTIDDVKQWVRDTSSFGLRATRFPGVDIDTLDATLAQTIEDASLAVLGPAPVRIGRAPKRLLMYRTDEPFSRMRLFIKRGQESHLVEILGEGQQYLVHGIHPATNKPYEWWSPITGARMGTLPAAHELVTITRDQASAFLDHLRELLELIGYGVAEREGDGRVSQRAAAGDQSSLVAPSIEALHDAVAMIPNSNDLFPTREDYIKVGYAIRAACGENIEEGFHIFADWAARWDGGDNDPDTVRADWRRMKPPFALGWSWLTEQARRFGFNDAAFEFDADEEQPVSTDTPTAAVLWSDQYLADRVVEMLRGEIRFSKQRGTFYAWDARRWEEDANLRAEDKIKLALRELADERIRCQGASAKEFKDAEIEARQICSSGKVGAVRSLVQMDRQIAINIDALDHDPWALNTPGGVVDLKTGRVTPPDPDKLCTKTTAVVPDFTMQTPVWNQFLSDATAGDVGVQRFMQRLTGYCLTGSTEEQVFGFIWGPGGNGKGVFLSVVSGILGDYAKAADMATFTASNSDKHSTDVAMLAGARLVTAQETEAGKRWDEAKVKALTGGDPVTARFMRQDNFTFTPQFKLLFVGNHKPELRNVDPAMRRRVIMVPFTHKPPVVDKRLGTKLKTEWPGILAWMVRGCLAWQSEGLEPPALVKDFTEDYFAESDAIGAWLRERTEPDAEATALTRDLFDDYREWANQNGEYVGSTTRFGSALASRGFEKWKHPRQRTRGFKGIRLTDRQDPGFDD